MIFNADFYPTPIDVIEKMIGHIDLFDKFVLEPSSGSGNILDYISSRGGKTIACEKSDQLSIISKEKSDVFLKSDFIEVTKDEISHIDYIVVSFLTSQIVLFDYHFNGIDQTYL